MNWGHTPYKKHSIEFYRILSSLLKFHLLFTNIPDVPQYSLDMIVLFNFDSIFIYLP